MAQICVSVYKLTLETPNQSKMDNPENLAVHGTQDEEKQHKKTKQLRNNS